ncbi:hypothetical protein IFM89_031549 [Coptis chinensis]|uniref:Pentatricopeptide repeat-containing protein n=1 Tax=Coptis chinensis TaxID=261450 RepID=A0A835ID16_9MAGN|nr:hypothetical protein IFM89_031549 [Coptis chinensis]
MNANNIKGNSQTHSIITRTLVKANRYEEAEHFMTQMLKDGHFPQKGICDSLIQGLISPGESPERAFSVLQQCLKFRGMSPSRFTFCMLVHSFSCYGNMDRVIEVLELMSGENFRYPFDNFVCSSVISGFCKIGKPELALGFYDNVEKSGVLRCPNVVTYTAIVSALCKEGRVKEVCELVHKMENEGVVLDAVFYSSWICGYFEKGVLDEAFRKHREMLCKGIKPDTVSYTILIDGFSKEGNVEKAVGFLNEMKKDGLRPNLVTYTAIMRGFCKRGKLEEAFGLFQRVEELGIQVDEITYSTLIDGLCRRGDFDRVFLLLEEMEKKGIIIGIITYNTVINGLCKVGRTSEASEISNSIFGDNFTFTTLLHGYVQENNLVGILETKRRVEESGIRMDVVMCNVLIKALIMLRAFEDAYSAFKGMPEMGLLPDSVTYLTMIDGYCKTGRIDEALEIFDACRGTSSVATVGCYNVIIRALCWNGLMSTGSKLLFPIMLNSYVKEYGLSESKIGMILVTYLCEKDVTKAISLLDKMKDNNLLIAIPIAAVEALTKQGRALDAHKLIVKTRANNKSSDVIAYSIVVDGLCKGGHLHMALDLCATMRKKGILPNIVTYNTVISGLCQQGCLVEALRLFDSLEKISLAPTVMTYGTLISALSKVGYFNNSKQLFEKMVRAGISPHTHLYNSLIDGYCKFGLLDEALKLLLCLEKSCCKPDAFTVSAVINGFCRKGDMEGALTFYYESKRKDILPDFSGFVCIVKGLSVKGRMEEARSILKEMLEISSNIDLINRAGDEKETESLASILISLCEQGNIEQATSIIGEVGSVAFSSKKRYSASASLKKHSALSMFARNSLYAYMGSLGMRFPDLLKMRSSFEESDCFSIQPIPLDFSACYSLVSSLCSEGKLDKANEVVQEMLLNTTKGG